MRKLLSFLLIFNLAHATAPTGYKNETASSKTYAQDLVFPNNQLTKQAGLDSRIETGNTNLLTNPSFEHSTMTTGWTITNATASADNTNQVEGKKALSLALTGALSVVQDSTINAANLVGLQGVARIKIKTSDVDGLKVCARNAGVTSTSLCINIPKDGAWKEINIPNILTATSNGIAITSTGATGTVKLDDAFVGTSAPFQGVSGAKLVGTLSYAPTINCIWQTTSATFANFAADTDCSTPTVTGNIKAPSTKIPAIVLPTGSQSGTYLITAKAMFYKGTAGYASYRFSDGTNYVNAGSSSYADNTATGIISGQITYSTSINSDTTIQIQGKTATGNLSTYSNDTTDGLYIEVYYYPPESKIYSQTYYGAESIEALSSTTTYGSTNTGVPVLTISSNTNNGVLTVNSDSTNGTSFTANVTAEIKVTAQVVGTVNGASFFVTKNATTLTSTTPDGIKTIAVSYTNAPRATLNSVFKVVKGDIVRIQKSDSGTNTVAYVNIVATPTDNPITGSFAGIEKCANDYECTDTFSAQISTSGVLTNFNTAVAWATCSYSSPTMTCTYISGLKNGTSNLSSPMNCEATTVDTASITGNTVNFKSNSSTGFSYGIGQDGVSNTNKPISIKCQKGTNDYKPKTAKVATSIGVPTVQNPGTKAYDFISVSYGTTNATTACSASPCSYLDQFGSGSISTMSRTGAGAYTLNTTRTYARIKCVISCAISGGNGCTTPDIQGSSTNALAFVTVAANTGAATNSYGSLMCIGEY